MDADKLVSVETFEKQSSPDEDIYNDSSTTTCKIIRNYDVRDRILLGGCFNGKSGIVGGN